MQYISTRGDNTPRSFFDVCLSGLAVDGGLYVPVEYPQITPPEPDETYTDIAARVLQGFAGAELTLQSAKALCEKAYQSFSHTSIAPLSQIGPSQWIMELYHGPSLAFKDVAMQLIAQIYDHALTQRKQRLTIICATSGDTGGAAASAFAHSNLVDVFILHPKGRVSDIQRRYMTTTGAHNVHNIEIDGDFDQAQAIVKGLFADVDFRDRVNLSGVNSINWARIAAQSVYYASAQAALGQSRPIRFITPTGNFGDALAGYIASRCGLLSSFRCLAAVNANRTLADLLNSGICKHETAHATLSPAMDIQAPSNFERLLFDAAGRDPEKVRAFYQTYGQLGEGALSPEILGFIRKVGISSISINDADTAAQMQHLYQETGRQICPHTCVASHAASLQPSDEGRVDVILATAHPAKFPKTALDVLGIPADLPPSAKHIMEREEEFVKFSPDQARIAEFISDNITS